MQLILLFLYNTIAVMRKTYLNYIKKVIRWSTKNILKSDHINYLRLISSSIFRSYFGVFSFSFTDRPSSSSKSSFKGCISEPLVDWESPHSINDCMNWDSASNTGCLILFLQAKQMRTMSVNKTKVPVANVSNSHIKSSSLLIFIFYPAYFTLKVYCCLCIEISFFLSI